MDALGASRARTIQSAVSASVSSGKMTSITPPPVATPRPPLNRRGTGNTRPRTAARPLDRAGPREHVPEDRGDAEDVGAPVAVHRQAEPGGERALQHVQGEDH